MLNYDPVPWLIEQEGLSAVRARRLLDLHSEGDEQTISTLECAFAKSQSHDGSFDQSIMKTAGILNLLNDLKSEDLEKIIAKGVLYLMSVLESQPGHELAQNVKPGGLATPLDLCGFFGRYENQRQPDMMALGAREMNFYREYEPLFGPKNPVRDVRRSSFDRVGPSSCYSWGLIPLCYITETLCRAGHSHDERLQPAINILLGVQRDSGGWCRNLGGHPNCTIHAVRVLGVHPELRQSHYSERAIKRLQEIPHSNVYATLQVLSRFDLPIAKEVIHDILANIIPRQRKNGTFGADLKIERVVAVLLALKVGGETQETNINTNEEKK
jgi:hypothetical protein